MNKITIGERIYNQLESFIMDKLVSQNSPGPVFKWIFKIPILQYKLGLGWLTGSSVLLLITTGRKSGKLHHTPLEYIYDREYDRYRIAAGWGGKTDWYRNAHANPHVTVQVGRKKFAAIAGPVSDEEVAKYMMHVS
jgi:deazaflavin-dependent oxidoreductase (nitroreductase family)